MNQSSGAMAALRIVLVGLLGGWALFVAGVFVQERGSGHGPATADTYDWSIYVFLAAVALFGGACLLGARRARRAAPAEPVLGRAAYHHAIAGLIVAAAAGALALAVVFFSLFASDPDTVLIRVVNAYLPIVAFTAVVVALLLAGFVFRGPAPTSPPAPGPPAPGPVAHLPPPADTRNSALAYAVPIIVAALAAIATGIVYDLTDTSLTAWVWALIFAIVGAGIVAGTYFASKLPAPSGAYGLNFAWVIAFAAVGSAVALGFGAASVQHLSMHAGVSMTALTQPGETRVDLHGYDLAARSEATLTLAGSGTELYATSADGEGWFYEEAGLPALPEGRHDLVLRATAADGTVLEATLEVTVTDGQIDAPEPFAEENLQRTLPVSAAWVGNHVLPAFLLILAVAVVVYLTVPLRARTGAARAVRRS